MSIRGLRGAIVAVAGAGLLAGCAGLHAYDPGKDAAAKDIKAKYETVELLKVIQTERQNLDSLLGHELKVIGRYTAALRDLRLFGLVDSTRTVAEFYARPEQRLRELGVRRSQLRGVALAYDRLEDLARSVAEAQESLAAMTTALPPACRGVDSVPETIPKELLTGRRPRWTEEALRDAYATYRTICRDNFEALAEAFAKLTSGKTLRKAYDGWIGELAEARRLDEEARTADAGYQAALHAYDDVVEKSKGKDPAEVKRAIEAAAGALRKALAALESAGSRGAEAAAEQRLKALDRVVTAVAGDEKPKDGGDKKEGTSAESMSLSRAVAVAALLPTVAADVTAVAQRAGAPSLGNLLIEKERLLIKRDYAARAVARAEQRRELLRAKLAALVLEIAYYQEMDRLACDFVEASTGTRPEPDACVGHPALDSAFLAGFKTSSPTGVKRALYQALLNYANAIGIARARQEILAYRLITLAHQEAADADEEAVRSWSVLIATPINQLAAYHATGFKPAEVADIIVKALGLGAIAARVR